MKAEDQAKHRVREQSPGPNPDLKGLEKFIGTWELTGGAKGRIRFDWTEGGFFLIQHVDLEHDGRRHKGIEIIGHEQKIGGEPSQEIRSRYYGFSDGLTQDYVYEVDGDELTIWMGEKGSPAFCRGKFGEDGDTMTAEWTYPGGGYKVIGTRVKDGPAERGVV
jgi:hypothetical protein